jgi:hypothetical protein
MRRLEDLGLAEFDVDGRDDDAVSASRFSPSSACSASRSGSPEYLGPSTERLRSRSRLMAPSGKARLENTSGPCSTNKRTRLDMGTS